MTGEERFKRLLGELQDLHVAEVAKLSAELVDLRDQLRGPRMSPPIVPPHPALEEEPVAKVVSNLMDPTLTGDDQSPDDAKSGKPAENRLKIPKTRNGGRNSNTSLLSVSEEEDLVHSDTALRERMKAVFLSTNFEFVVALLIIANLLFMALQLQYHGFVTGNAIGYPRYESSPEALWPYADEFFFWGDFLFALLFTLEMLIRLAKIKWSFFRHCLNWADLLVVGSGWAELYAQGLPISPTFLRLLRLGKLLRALRVVRMSQVLESLQLLLKCIYASLRILFWSLVLLMIIQCSAGMTISYMLSDFMVNDNSNAEARFQVFRYYGTFSKTLLTMFEVLFANWAPACRVLIDNVSEWYSVAFVVYRCFVGFAVLNVVNAVFIQSTMKVAHQDEEVIAFEKAKAQDIYRRRVNNMFREADTSGDGCIDFQEFKRMLEHPQLQVWLHQLDIETVDLIGLFSMLDDGDGEISLEEFETGIQKIKGMARSFELNKLQRQVKKIGEKLELLLSHSNIDVRMSRRRQSIKTVLSPTTSREVALSPGSVVPRRT